MFNLLFKLSSNICNFNYHVDFNHAKHQILFTQHNRFMGSSEQLPKRMVVIVWIACTELENEFANSENVLYKRCFVMFEKVGKKLTFFKLVKSNSLTTVEKNS